ncbi:diguanylate cyclase (GGDEF) domain-containing protein [Arsukibacterium tuosuense]|uniref:Diguanylate cyclase (GGDEF) domain-containing protein n=1 Tax=Arsukibacterium tuosuense TaxID=1323745 RepID=A0A285IN02_9GAMM|nr:GGDEF domain-containing protein [Arsukibacterium tuosuense]SNY49369.1 diguanylate cyclase (GGDEF) domain-containing protein [Arsukibacterium tuosuense]
MNEPMHPNPEILRNSVLKLYFDAQGAELIRLRCEFLLQHNIWYQRQQEILRDNQVLSVALLHASAINSSTVAQLDQLTHDSQCDTLTQTLNRSIMLDRIEQAISLSKRKQRTFALLFIDLNNFKPINDQYGHAAGDAILQQVSSRLQHAIRDSDAVSRHGGDEFLLLLNDVNHPQDAGLFAGKLEQLLAEPYHLATGEVSLSASIGIAQFPADADTAMALINHADAAMYRVKQKGGASAR